VRLVALSGRSIRLLPILVVFFVSVLTVTSAAAALSPGRSVSQSPSSLTVEGSSVAPTPELGHGQPGHPLTFSPSSAGSVAQTVFVNYNGSAPGNFPSAVWLWDASGVAAVDSVTNQLWIPEFPISVDNIPAPPNAPALAYDSVTNQTEMVMPLANSSAIAYDPLNGYLYATQPLLGAVVAFDPLTDSQVGPSIPVGGDPHSIVYDPVSHDIWVANAASDNISIINGSTGLFAQSIPNVGVEPYALGVDVRDQLMFVASAAKYLGVYNVTAINSTTFSPLTTRIFLSSAPDALAVSDSADLLAVASSDSTLLSFFHAALQTPAGGSVVGYNVSSVIANQNGSEFVASNTTEPHLSIVPAVSGFVTPVSLAVSHPAFRLTLDPTDGRVFSWSETNRTVSTVNLTASLETQLSPDLAAETAVLAYDPGSNSVFVTDWASHSVSVINASSFRTVRQPLNLPGIPTSITDDPATGIVYVGFTGGVLAINAKSGAIIAENTMPDLAGNNTQLVVDAQSGLLWDLNEETGLYALDIPSLTLQLATGIAAGTVNLQGVALDSETNTLFVVNRSNPALPTLVAVDGSNGTVNGTPIASIPGLLSVAYDSADHKIYALGVAVWVVNPNNHTVMAGPIPIAPHVVAWSIVYDPSREYLYIASNGSSGPPWPGNITVIDGSSVAASQVSYTTFPAGQLPIDSLPVQLPGSSAPGSSEIWVSNFISGTISIIASLPRITFLAASPNPVDVGATTSILLGYVGGAGASTISYSGLPAGCASQDSTTINCTVNSAATYTINATVQDALENSVQSSTVLSVNPALALRVQLNGMNSSEIDLGNDLVGRASVTGGTGPFNYSWTFADGSTAWGANVSHTYSTVGTYVVTVIARDAGGGVSSVTDQVTVQPLPTVQVAAAPSNVTDVGFPVTFTAVQAGGASPGTTYWTFGDGATANGTTVRHAYTAPGAYFATVHYTDAAGEQVSNFTTVTVNNAMSATYKVATGPTSPSLAAGSSVSTGTSLEFSTSISGGTAPFTIVWGFGDGSYGYGVESTHAFATPGSYNVTLFVEDAVGAEWNASYHLTVTSSSSSSSFGSNFDEGLVLGIILGAAIAAVILFVAARPRSKPPASPPTPFVPPAKVEPEPAGQPWQES
jgi:DNA-binding beta-propeller fold protein YncE/PKD repeat protein